MREGVFCERNVIPFLDTKWKVQLQYKIKQHSHRFTYLAKVILQCARTAYIFCNVLATENFIPSLTGFQEHIYCWGGEIIHCNLRI